MVEEQKEEDTTPDINANKFAPEILHLSRDAFANVSQIQTFLNYSLTLKAEESFGLVIEDAQYESTSTDIVDAAFGGASVVPTGTAAGGVRYLNLSGLGRIEKSVKVRRYEELLKFIASL